MNIPSASWRARAVMAGVITALLPVAVIVNTSTAPTSTAQSSASAPMLATVATPRPSNLPNVVLITTDDQALSDMRYMPKTRRLLGGQGVTFENMLSPHPLCCPARAEILTGQYAQNNNVFTNGGKYGGYGALRNPDDTLPVWLQREGYHTSMVGKFMNKWRPKKHATPPGWGDFQASPRDSFGFYDFKMWANGTVTSYEGTDAYSTNYVTDAVVDRINTWAGTPASTGDATAPSSSPSTASDGSSSDTQGAPFFIWASYYAPHGDCPSEGGCKVPPVPERKYDNVLTDERAPALGKKSLDAPLDNPNPVIAGREVVPVDQIQHHFIERIQALQSVDDGVEKIVSTLKATGELDNTILLFTSDNGYLIGEHRYIGKVLGYEESLRVPLLMRGPGIPKGEVRKDFVTTVDLAPTIMAAAGADAKRTVDGRDIMPLAKKGPVRRDPLTNTILIQAGNDPAASEYGPVMYRGVRTDRWTYIKWSMPDGSLFFELYDSKNDPHQVDNLAGEERYAAIEAELLDRTRALADCTGPRECFRTWDALPDQRSQGKGGNKKRR